MIASGISNITLPLMMRDIGIEIKTIGLVFALFPMIFQSIRMFFAVLSDVIGRRPFFTLAGVSSSLCYIIYRFALSPLHFAFGKVSEALWNASLWSVNRAYVMEHSTKRGDVLVKMIGLTSISLAVGSLFAGFLISFMGYRNTVLFCSLFGLIVAIICTSLKETKRLKIKSRKVRKGVRKFLVPFFILGISNGFVSSYVITLFLQGMGISPEGIGILITVQLLVAGIILSFLMFGVQKRVVYLIFPLSIIMLIVVPPKFMLLAFLFFGLGFGISRASVETLLPRIVDHEHYGRDIGILMMSAHIGNTVSTAFSGFVISSYGFSASFVLGAIFFILYLLLSTDRPLTSSSFMKN